MKTSLFLSHIKSILITTIFFSLPFILNFNTVNADESSNETEYQEVLISYTNEEGKNLILNKAEEITYSYDFLPAFNVKINSSHLELLKHDTNIKIAEEIGDFSTLETDVQIIDENELYSTSYSSDLIWNLAAMNINQAHEKNHLGENVKIGIIDTGISTHTNLTITSGISTVKYTTSWEDDNGHGSQVAGIINSKKTDDFMGISPHAKIYAIKALDKNGQGKLPHILEGIDWAIKNEMDILNLSFGSEFHSDELEYILNEAKEQGILLVGASGNSGDGYSDTLEYPAKYESVISVGSISQKFKYSTFSSTGPKLEIVAPGEAIKTTHLNNQYAYVTGTSFAAPHVTSLLAIYKSTAPDKTNNQISSLLLKDSIDLGVRGNDPMYGYGLANFKIHENTSEPIEGIAKNSKTNVYLAPNTASNIIRTYPLGQELKLKSFSEEWYIATIYLDGVANTGYININDVEIPKLESINLKGIALKSPTNVYDSTSKNSSILRSYSEGHILQYKTFSEEWYIATVYLNGKPTTGFIHVSDTENLLDHEEHLQGIALDQPTQVYSSPSENAEVHRSYKQGHLLKYQTFSENWYIATVYLNGEPTTGFIHVNDTENLLDHEEHLQGIALDQPTQVYSSPSENSKVLRSYPQGHLLRYRTFSENWYIATVYIDGNPTTGFIRVSDTENLLDHEEHLQGIALDQPTQVYSSPSENSKVIRSYEQGHILRYRTFSENWYIATVYLDGIPNTGYIKVDSVN